MHERNK